MLLEPATSNHTPLKYKCPNKRSNRIRCHFYLNRCFVCSCQSHSCWDYLWIEPCHGPCVEALIWEHCSILKPNDEHITTTWDTTTNAPAINIKRAREITREKWQCKYSGNGEILIKPTNSWTPSHKYAIISHTHHPQQRKVDKKQAPIPLP